MKKVSIVVPVYNQLKMTINCLNDVLKTSGVDIEIIVVDDGSKEPIRMAIPKLFPTAKLLYNETNLGFAKTVNKGISAATSDYILLLNNDIQIDSPFWLKIMLEAMEKRQLDMVAPAGGRMNGRWEYQPGEAIKEIDDFSYLVGWCLLIHRRVFNKIGLVSQAFGRGFWEDVLFSYDAKKAGFKLGIVENTKVRHLYHQTFKAEGYDLNKEYHEKRKIFLEVIKK